MKIIHLSTTLAVLALSITSSTSYAENNNQNWMPNAPSNTYWQAPNWSGFNMPSNYNNYRPAPHQGYMSPPQNYRPPAPPQAVRNTAPNTNNTAVQQNNNTYRGNMPPPPRGPYNNPNYRDNGASAYNFPGYNPNNNNNSGWGNWNRNNMWGNSGPRKWMNPNKSNMEQGWDDMINAPSRMGEMPGGWTAPEISVPNPIDVGDQFQDNIKDLPEQIRNMDVGN